jgi:thioredoxin reductase
MHGLGYSVRTYAHLVTGKPVAVIGSTLRALRGTAELARIAERVYVVAPYPGALETPLGQALADRPNIELLQHYHVKELVGINRLEEVIIARDGDTRRLHVAHAFVDLGLVPNSQAVQRLGVTNSAGFIEVDRQNATTVPGLYAAGDVTTAAGEQVLVAIGDGARAAMSGYDYLLARWLAGAVQERAVGGEGSN